jgi:hypothetical protein
MTDEERIKKYIEFVEGLIEKHFEGDRKEKIKAMLEEIGDRYFTAPAASRTDHHSCYPGGLVGHTLQVTKNVLKVRACFEIDIPEESFVLVGLFHDIGKIGTREGEAMYLPQTSDWHRNKGMLYTFNDKLQDGLTHAQRSVRLLGQFGIELSDDEYLAILGHDGLYKEENRTRDMMYASAPLSRALHTADMWSALVEDI